MSAAGYVQSLDLAAGLLLLTAVLIVWRRELAVIIRVLAVQGLALTALVVVLAVRRHAPELVAVAAGVAILRVGLLPYLLRRALADAGQHRRETRPLVNVVASLLAIAVLTMLAYSVSGPLIALAPSAATEAIPVALALVLIGFFVLVTRSRALSQLVGFLVMDNGITAVGFLTTAGAGLAVELGASLDVLLVVLVLHLLAGRMWAAFGHAELDELRELRDS